MDKENLGPAERIIQTVLAYSDHMVHNRPGLVVADPSQAGGVRWEFVTHKVENGQKIVYRLVKQGGKTVPTRAGVLQQDGKVYADNGAGEPVRPLREVGEYRKAGLYPEVVTWLYKQVADIWRLDNEFAARWASYQYGLEHKDLKVILAAFMLVQSRKGDPVVENGSVVFHDDDFRDVGEAMMLSASAGGKDLNPKLLMRVREVLEVPGVAALNRELGFGKSTRTPALGRWVKVVHKWLLYREENPKMLKGLVKAGFRTTVMALASRSGYKPTTKGFFDSLRWKQGQSKDGRRGIAIGEAVAAAESWAALTEQQVCEKIVKERPNYKRVVGMLSSSPVGITRAVMAAAIEAGSLSDKDLIMATPTIEDLGLMEIQDVKDRWMAAVRRADDMRAANIATRVKSQATKEALEGAADTALKAAAEEVMKGMRVYVFVDRSGSMESAIEAAIRLVTRLLPAFPADKLHVAYFNTTGQEVTPFKAQSAAGVAQAFRGITASGGTDYGSGVKVLERHKPSEDEDVLFIFVGDQEAPPFAPWVQRSGLRPMAFGLVFTPGQGGARGVAVEQTAVDLGLPCFKIDEKTFEDTYAIPRTIRALVAATPVGVPRDLTARGVSPRVSLAETILKTSLLTKPAWAA
jgi:hypothetical protein